MRIPTFYRKRLDRWLDSRSPIATEHKLTQRNLYTFPNTIGLGLLVTILIIWVMGTNYQNNLVLAICYLLISFFVVAIWQAYSNLAGIQIKAITSHSGFAGDDINFTIELLTPNPSGCENLEISWPNGKKVVADFDANQPIVLDVPCTSSRRGILLPGRLLIESRYPLGVIRCWTHINLELSAVVFPKPIPDSEPEHLAGEDNADSRNHKKGGDDPGTLRHYQPGDSLKHIAWKLFARERGLHTKQTEQTISDQKWLDWFGLSLAHEHRLSVLCYWALEYEKKGCDYGLILPDQKIVPSKGQDHLQQVLSALALWGISKGSGEKIQ